MSCGSHSIPANSTTLGPPASGRHRVLGLRQAASSASVPLVFSVVRPVGCGLSPSATPYGWPFLPPVAPVTDFVTCTDLTLYAVDPRLHYSSVVPARLIGRGVHFRVPGRA